MTKKMSKRERKWRSKYKQLRFSLNGKALDEALNRNEILEREIERLKNQLKGFGKG